MAMGAIMPQVGLEPTTFYTHVHVHVHKGEIDTQFLGCACVSVCVCEIGVFTQPTLIAIPRGVESS